MEVQSQQQAMDSPVKVLHVSGFKYLKFTDIEQRQIFCYLLGGGCLAATFVTFSPSLSKPKYSLLRALMFIGLGFAAGIQIVIQSFQPSTCLDLNISAYVLGGSIYIIGAMIYVVRYPERC